MNAPKSIDSIIASLHIRRDIIIKEREALDAILDAVTDMTDACTQAEESIFDAIEALRELA